MSEYEIIYLLSETLDRIWSIIQFWSGVSFGYLAMSYVAAKYLNSVIVIFLTGLYAVFSLAMFEILGGNYAMLLGHVADLTTIASEMELTSSGAKNYLVLQEQGRGSFLAIALFGTFVASICYLPYNYFIAQRKPSIDIS